MSSCWVVRTTLALSWRLSDKQCLEKLQRAKPNLGVLQEYKKREEEFLKRAKDVEMVTAERDSQKQKYDELRKQRLDEFMAGFNLISLKLKEMYQVSSKQCRLDSYGLIHTRSFVDDHHGRQCRAGAGRQYGSLL